MVSHSFAPEGQSTCLKCSFSCSIAHFLRMTMPLLVPSKPLPVQANFKVLQQTTNPPAKLTEAQHSASVFLLMGVPLLQPSHMLAAEGAVVMGPCTQLPFWQLSWVQRFPSSQLLAQV